MSIVELTKTTAVTVIKSQIMKKVVAYTAGVIVTGLVSDAYQKHVIGPEDVSTEV